MSLTEKPCPTFSRPKKFLGALLLLAIIAAVSAFLLTARGNPPVAATDHSNVSGPA